MRPYASCVLLFLMLQAGAVFAAESAQISYRLSLQEHPVGTARLIVQEQGNLYTLTLESQLAENSAQAWTTGAIGRRGLTPSLFTAEIARGAVTRRIGIGFEAGKADFAFTVPPFRPEGERVPLDERHRQGAIDPLSALVIPAALPGYGPLSACARTHPVFDGSSRFDLVLFPSRSETILVQREPLLTLACRVRLRPVAGHPRATVGAAELRGIIWFAPVIDGRLLAPARAEVDTRHGKLLLEAQDVSPFRAGLRPVMFP